MIPDSRKLKRGLSDISPLFETNPGEPALIETAVEKKGFRLASLFSAEGEGAVLRLSRSLAAQLSARNRGASILSLREKKSWDKFQEICQNAGRPSDSHLDHTLFLDFDYSNFSQFQKVVPLLDQWILLLRPEMESLSECYRMMKSAVALGNHLETFLLFDRIVSDDQASRLFEKYGEFVSRRLGVHLSWLGSIQSQNGNGNSIRLALETLFLAPSAETESIEKRALANLLLQANSSRDFQ